MSPTLVDHLPTGEIFPAKPLSRDTSDAMPPGRYFVGDLWYVIQASTWDEEVRNLMHNEKQTTRNIYQLKDGRRFALFQTNENGRYLDDRGRKYAVDSSTIGCIHVDDVDHVLGKYVSKRTSEYWKRLNKFGRVIHIRRPFYPYHSGYSTVFGPVEVFLDNVLESDTERDSDV